MRVRSAGSDMYWRSDIGGELRHGVRADVAPMGHDPSTGHERKETNSPVPRTRIRGSRKIRIVTSDPPTLLGTTRQGPARLRFS